MERLGLRADTPIMTQTHPAGPLPRTDPAGHPGPSPLEPHDRLLARVGKALAARSFCTLATTSPAHRPHVAGVLYEAVGTTLYVSTLRTSRKARNVAANPYVAVCVPVRRLPVGPPSSLQFQATGAVLTAADPEIAGLVADGQLRSITGHGELELRDGCFLRITPAGRIATYGLGLPLRRLMRDPLNAGGAVLLPQGGPGTGR